MVFNLPVFNEVLTVTEPDLPADVLSSKQFSTVLDLLCEGEIEGFPSASGLTKGTTAYNNAALKDVFLNGTQILQTTADNTNPLNTDFNFPNITFTPRFGTSTQTPIQGITASESETAVNVEVTKSTPVNRTINNTEVDAVRVTLGFPQLQSFKDDGDIEGAEVAINIQTIENDGTTTTVITDVVKGKASNMYFRDYKINFPSGTSFPVTIRVNRTTDDSTDATLQNKSTWSSFTEIINEQKAYINSAYIALRLDAKTFPSIPQRMYKIRGTKIKIPHNGTVLADGSISYSGTFNGTFKTDKEYSNDPAWVLYDLLTTSKGFGDQIDTTQLDVFSFYSASVYCSEQVDNGIGGTEPRFSTNVILNTQRDAYSLINDLSSVMRVMPFYSAGVINISQDRPTDPSYIYNLSNVTEEGFSYSNASKSTKATVVNVAYFDNETKTVDYETVEDTALQTKYGVVVRNLKGFATTSRGQAARLGKWFLYTQSNESEIVTFSTTLESGTLVRCGAIINIQDPMRAGLRRGGRIQSVASTTVITVDDEHNTDLIANNNAVLSVILPDGSLESRTISSISNREITVSTAFSTAPQKNSVWVIEDASISLQTFRVVSITETEKLIYEIIAVAHNPSKYANVEDGVPLQGKVISNLTALKPSPSSLSAVEQIVVINQKAVSKLFITWQAVQGAKEYMLQYRFNNENFTSLKTLNTDFAITDTKAGTYEIRVFTYNALGKPSTSPSQATFTTVGKTALPADPQNLTIEPINDQFVRLRFDKSTDVDVLHGGTVVVRHTPNSAVTDTFEKATGIVQAQAGNVTEVIVPAMTSGKYLIKFQDDGGRFSENAAQVILTEPAAQPSVVILQEREDTDSPPFQGNKKRCFYDADFDGLLLDGTLLWDSITQNIDDLSNIDFASPISSSAEYDFENTIDLGAKFNLNLVRHLVTDGILPNDLMDSRTANIDTWDDFDGLSAASVDAKVLIATTDGDPAAAVAATYSQTAITVTVSKTSHGFSVGDFVVFTVNSGTAETGFFQILSTGFSENQFVLISDVTQNTSGNCTLGSAFKQFNEFANGKYTARGFKFRCLLSNGDPAQNINIKELGFTASLNQRTETVNSVIASQCATNSAAKSVTFDAPFFTGTASLGGSTTAFLPTIGITLEGAVSGDYFTIPSIAGTGFTIETRDANNNFKNLNFKYTAIGFGKGS
jgi:predicted phage tail protein